jgi:hypothetical protein
MSVNYGSRRSSDRVQYYEAPAEYGVGDYRYTIVNGRSVLFDPPTQRVVEFIDCERFRRGGPFVGARGRMRRQGYDTDEYRELLAENWFAGTSVFAAPSSQSAECWPG